MAGLTAAKALCRSFKVTVVDAKDYFHFTSDTMRAYVDPAHFDRSVFMLRPVVEQLGATFVCGQVLEVREDGTCEIARYDLTSNKLIERFSLAFDYCIAASGCSYNPFHKWGESLWTPTIHHQARGEGSWSEFEERSLEGRRQRMYDEYEKLRMLNELQKRILVIGGGYIGVKWAMELKQHFPLLDISIMDVLPHALGPLPVDAAQYCESAMQRWGIHQFYSMRYDDKSETFWTNIGFPNGARPEKEYICVGVKASTDYMPKQTLSEKGPGGGGWIYFNMKGQVTTADGELLANGRIFVVGDCDYGAVQGPGAMPDSWPIPPQPKSLEWAQRKASLVCENIFAMEGCGVMRDFNAHGKGYTIDITLGRNDGVIVTGVTHKKGSGYVSSRGQTAASQIDAKWQEFMRSLQSPP